MRWTHLGHAMWLATLGDVRVLFDPLLTDAHHGGVLEVHPRRVIDVEALRPDFVIVSHAHPDHFDVRSLHRLATLDPDTVLLTSDPLVEHAARRVGFRTVQRLDAGQRVDLDGATLVTTPPGADVVEWGVMAVSREGVVWNQVDTQLPDPAAVRALLTTIGQQLERTDVAHRMALALVCWQPLLEVSAQLGLATRFPMAAWSRSLDRMAALDAKVVIPSSAGARHSPVHDAMNDLVYPVTTTRALRDIEARAPSTRALRPGVGHRWEVRGGEVFDDGPDPLVLSCEPERDERFHPLSIAPVRDPNLAGYSEEYLAVRIERWVRDELASGLARAYSRWRALRTLHLVLEVVLPTSTRAYTLAVNASGTTVSTGSHGDHDVLNVVAGSMLLEVIEGRRGWGDVLLAGLLRASFRAYEVTPMGLTRTGLGDLFVYEALSYDESFRRAIEHELSNLILLRFQTSTGYIDGLRS